MIFSFIVSASITQPQNGMEAHGVLGKLESDHYYTYPCNQALGPAGVQPMPPMPNGEPSALSPTRGHKRLKRSNMGSMSSVDDDGESVGDEGQPQEGQVPAYYHGKSPSNSLNGGQSWQGEHNSMDPGTYHPKYPTCNVSQPLPHTTHQIQSEPMILNIQYTHIYI